MCNYDIIVHLCEFATSIFDKNCDIQPSKSSRGIVIFTNCLAFIRFLFMGQGVYLV
eukprot:TRINITY_DN2020_c0_g1_i4.p1 TRINITY_DN2020_c0_g1~~TRINITY_DN2020_c0_g1_i4.p1  ORF type:complete len:56 (+),score=3.54 TRINITY_DN2020_c0_g1_i4:99-266(+)